MTITASIADRTTLSALTGHTPLVRLGGTPGTDVELYGKAEWANPSGSVKDRAAARILREGGKSGELRPGKTILDATSGNTGIAFAMFGAARGYPVTLCLPGNANFERRRMLRAYGATLILTDPMEGADGAVAEARRLQASDPARYFYANQYDNPANWQAHYDSTGLEILAQTEGRVTHFVAGIGTSGTFVGTGRRLREHNPNIRLIAVQPDSPLHGLEGMKHLLSASVPRIYDPTLADEILTVSTEEAHDTTRKLAREEGLFVGVSSGANVAAARRVARRLREAVVVTILCDGGLRYLSESFWEES